MKQKQIEMFEKIGFQKPTDYELFNFSDFFNITPEYYYEPIFAVKGDHSFDAVQILYVEKRDIKGFYYNSSLIDFLYIQGYKKEIVDIFNDLKNYLKQNDFIDNEFVFEEGYHCWFIIKTELEDPIITENIVAEFIKITAILDFFAQKIYEKTL